MILDSQPIMRMARMALEELGRLTWSFPRAKTDFMSRIALEGVEERH